MVSTFWCFWVASFFSSRCGSYMRQKETERTHHCVIPRILSSLANLPSLCFSESFSVCFIYNAQEFSVLFSGGNRERYIYSLFPEVSVCLNILCSCCVFKERFRNSITRFSLSLPAYDSQLFFGTRCPGSTASYLTLQDWSLPSSSDISTDPCP